MKRFYALIIVLVLIISCIHFTAASEEYVTSRMYYSRDYTDDSGYTHTVFSENFDTGFISDKWSKKQVELTSDPKNSGRETVVRFSGDDPWIRSAYMEKGKKLLLENYSTEELSRVRIKADMLFSEANAFFSLAGYNAYSGKLISLVTFNHNNKVYYTFNKASDTRWSDNNWCSVVIYLNLDSNIGTVKVNDIVVAKDVFLGNEWFSEDRAKRIDSLWFALGNQSTGSAYIDNVEYALQPPEILLEETDGRGMIEYTYCPDLLNGGDNAYLFIAISENGRLAEVSSNKISTRRLTGTDVKNTAASSGASYATEMVNEEINARIPERICVRYVKKSGQKLCVYLWNERDLKPLLGGDRCFDIIGDITTEEFAAEKTKWRSYIVGDNTNDINDGIIANLIEKINKDAKAAIQNLNRDKDKTLLFNNLTITTTADMTQSYVYLANMAKAYGTYGSDYYKNQQLKSDILSGVEWLYQNYYGHNEINGTPWRDTSLYNWWDWCVGTPIQLGTILLILEPELSAQDIERYLSPYDYLSAKLMTASDIQTIASKCEAGPLIALLKNDETAIKSYMSEICKVIEKTGMEPHTDGLRDDWNFVLHKNFPYAGGYGVSIIMERIVTVWSILSETELLPADFDDETFLLMLKNTFEPIVYGGKTMSAFMGRRGGVTESSNGASLIAKSLNLLGRFSTEDDAYIKHFIKRNISEANLQYIISKLNMGEAKVLSDILSDTTVSDTDDYEILKLYPTGDRVVWQKNGFALAISMSSNRVGNYESINNNNTTGWYTSDGAVYLYTDRDEETYGDTFWNNINPYHIAGTTVDTQTRPALSIKNPWFSNQHFVGSADLEGKYATAAMALESYHREQEDSTVADDYGGPQPLHNSTLTAKKSWFIFDDEVVCLGSDIDANDGFDVHTILENRLMTDAAKQIYIGANPLPEGAFEKTAENINLFSISGVGGWYFPEGQTVYLKRITGTNGFFEGRINHGNSPQNSKYAYVMLPKKSNAQANKYAKNPDVTILANGTVVQAVRENVTNVTGIVFWKAYSFGGITASEPLIFMKHETDSSVKVSVCDPTAKLTKASVTLSNKMQLKSSDKQITAEETADGTKLNIDFSNANGKTFYCEFVK